MKDTGTLAGAHPMVICINELQFKAKRNAGLAASQFSIKNMQLQHVHSFTKNSLCNLYREALGFKRCPSGILSTTVRIPFDFISTDSPSIGCIFWV